MDSALESTKLLASPPLVHGRSHHNEIGNGDSNGICNSVDNKKSLSGGSFGQQRSAESKRHYGSPVGGSFWQSLSRSSDTGSGNLPSDNQALDSLMDPVPVWELWKTPEWGLTFKSTVGSGFFALPFGFRLAGLAGAMGMVIAVAFFTLITTKQLIISAARYKRMRPHMREMAQVGFLELGGEVFAEGSVAQALLALSLLTAQFMAAVAYLVFVQTTLAPLLLDVVGGEKATDTLLGGLLYGKDGQRETAEDATRTLLLVMALGLQILLALRPDPSFLDKVASFGNAAFMASMACMVTEGLLHAPPTLKNTVAFTDYEGLIACFGVASFTMSAHAECLSIYCSAQPRAKASYPQVVEQVTVAVSLVYIPLAVFAYACYGDTIHESIFENITEGGSIPGKLLSVTICAMLLVNYPLTVFPVHQMLESWLGLAKNGRSGQKLTSAQVVSRYTIVALSGIAAFFAGNHFGGVSMAGGAFIALVAFVYPPLFFFTTEECSMGYGSMILNAIIVFTGLFGFISSLIEGIKFML